MRLNHWKYAQRKNDVNPQERDHQNIIMIASMSASGSAGPGFDPRRGSKFSFENFQPGLGGVEMYTS